MAKLSDYPWLAAGTRVIVDVHEDESPTGVIDEIYEDGNGEVLVTIVWDDTGCSTDDVRASDCKRYM